MLVARHTDNEMRSVQAYRQCGLSCPELASNLRLISAQKGPAKFGQGLPSHNEIKKKLLGGSTMIKLSSLARKGLTAAVVSTVAALALTLTTACSVNHYDDDRGHRYPPPPAAQKAPPRGPAHQAPAPRPSHKAPPRSPHRYERYHSIVTGPGYGGPPTPAPRPR